MEKKKLSCADCVVGNCEWEKGNFPVFCMTTHMDGSVKEAALSEYEKEEIYFDA